jgi:hypothetical protein
VRRSGNIAVVADVDSRGVACERLRLLLHLAVAAGDHDIVADLLAEGMSRCLSQGARAGGGGDTDLVKIFCYVVCVLGRGLLRGGCGCAWGLGGWVGGWVGVFGGGMGVRV